MFFAFLLEFIIASFDVHPVKASKFQIKKKQDGSQFDPNSKVLTHKLIQRISLEKSDLNILSEFIGKILSEKN